MDLTQLFKTIDAAPFRPFEIALLNGERARVDHPENVVFWPGRHHVTLVFVRFPPGDDYTFFWPSALAAIHVSGEDGGGDRAS